VCSAGAHGDIILSAANTLKGQTVISLKGQEISYPPHKLN